MSELYQSLSHSKWDCKYHVVFVPNDDERSFTGKYDGSWGEFSMLWPDRKNVRSSKGI